MAKKKKKGQNNAVYKTFKPFLKNNQMLLTILGAAAGGAALAALIGSDKAQKVIDDISTSVKDLVQKNDHQPKRVQIDAKKASPAVTS